MDRKLFLKYLAIGSAGLVLAPRMLKKALTEGSDGQIPNITCRIKVSQEASYTFNINESPVLRYTVIKHPPLILHS